MPGNKRAFRNDIRPDSIHQEVELSFQRAALHCQLLTFDCQLTTANLKGSPLLSQLIRLPLKFVPKGLVVPILSGPARGLKWVTGSGTHGCWLGTYERDRQQQLTELLKPGDCFLDIGANVGFYSVLASRIVGATGQVHSFEPFPRNVDYLQKHIELNRLTNVTVHPLALSDGPARTMTFATSVDPSSGRLLRDSDTSPQHCPFSPCRGEGGRQAG